MSVELNTKCHHTLLVSNAQENFSPVENILSKPGCNALEGTDMHLKKTSVLSVANVSRTMRIDDFELCPHNHCSDEHIVPSTIKSFNEYCNSDSPGDDIPLIFSIYLMRLQNSPVSADGRWRQEAKA